MIYKFLENVFCQNVIDNEVSYTRNSAGKKIASFMKDNIAGILIDKTAVKDFPTGKRGTSSHCFQNLRNNEKLFFSNSLFSSSLAYLFTD